MNTYKTLIAILAAGLLGSTAFANVQWTFEQRTPGADEGLEMVEFRPESSDAQLFFLESSNSLDGEWNVELVSNAAVDEHGMTVLEGIGNARFERLRAREPIGDNEDWPVRLSVHRGESTIYARVKVTANYLPAVGIVIDQAKSATVTWQDTADAGIDTATQEALNRLFELVGLVGLETGDEYWVGIPFSFE